MNLLRQLIDGSVGGSTDKDGAAMELDQLVDDGGRGNRLPDRIDEKHSFHRYHGPRSILMQIRMQGIKFSKKSPYEELKKTKKNVEKKKKQI